MTSTLARSEPNAARNGPDRGLSPEPPAWVRKLGLGASLVATALATWVCLTWAIGTPWLAATGGTWSAMPPWTSVLFLAEGLAAALLVSGRTTASSVLFVLPLIWASVLLTGYVRDWAPGIRLLLWPDRLATFQYELPGLPSRFALITIILLGLAGILSGRQTDLSVAVTVLLAVAALISVAAIVAYVYVLTAADAANIDIGMALTAALSASATVVAIAAARPTRLPMSLIHGPAVLLFALGLLLVVMSFPALVDGIAQVIVSFGGAAHSTAHDWATVMVVTVGAATLVILGTAWMRTNEWRRYSEAAAAAVLIVDSGGRVLDANADAALMLGSPLARIRGTPVKQWLPMPGSPGNLDDEAAHTARHTPGTSIQLKAMRADGSQFPADVSAHPMSGRSGEFTVLSIRDRTEEEELRSDRDRARQLLDQATDQSPIAHAVLDPDGTILQVNEAACRLAGLDASEMIGKSYLDFRNPDDPEPAMDFGRIVGDRPQPAQAPVRRWTRPDGSERWVELHLSPVTNEEGRTVALSLQTLDVTAEKHAEAEVERAMATMAFRSSHDVLTGLPNRRELLDEIEQFLGTADAEERRVAVLYCDLDDFKYVNDGISHEAGDEVLVQVANRLRAVVRHTDAIGRIGGDEFVIALRDVASPASAIQVATAVQALVAGEPYRAAGRKIRLGSSIGIAISSRGSDPHSLLREADAALRHAKSIGRSRCELFDEAMREESLRRVAIAEDLRNALDQDRIHAWYQPIVNLRDCSVVGYEALARWQRADGSVIPACDWIDVAEENGLILPIGDRILQQVALRLEDLTGDQWVSINGSASQITDKYFGRSITTWLSRVGGSPEQLVLEVTEQSILRSPTLAYATLDRLAQHDVKVYLDDFGTGYSSLTHLRTLPVSGIKLDRSFTELASGGADARQPTIRIVEGLADLAERLGLVRIAEGIEEWSQADTLFRSGWQYGQGWLFGRPAPELRPADVPAREESPSRPCDACAGPPAAATRPADSDSG